MITLHWYEQTMTAAKAVRGFDWIALYDEHNQEIHRIINITGKEWQYITLDGEWTPADEIPTATDQLRADVDYILMVIDEEA